MSPENQMQDSFDAWDAQMAAADADQKAYAHNLARNGGEDCCLAIENAWGLAGYPPQIVSSFLNHVAGGLGTEAALDKAEAGQ